MNKQYQSQSSNIKNDLKQFLQQIFSTFQQSGKIDIVNTKNIIQQQMINVEGIELFKMKLYSAIGKGKTQMKKQQFISYFSQDCTNKQHFDFIFHFIDKDASSMLNKQEIKQFIKKYNINLNDKTIQMMIDVVSVDGQKVKKQQLYKFLTTNFIKNN